MSNTIISQKSSEEKTVPAVALRESVVFPHTEFPLTFGRPKSSAAVKAAFSGTEKHLLAVFTQKDPRVEDPKKKDLYSIGTLVMVDNILEAEGSLTVIARGVARIRLEEELNADPYLLVKVSTVPEIIEDSEETKVLANHLVNEFRKAFNLGKAMDIMVLMRISAGVSTPELTDQIASTLTLKASGKIELLEKSEVKERLKKVSEYLAQEIKVLELDKTISAKTQARFDKEMRQAVLRERKRTIEKELGEKAGEEDELVREFRKKIREAQMPQEAKKKVEKELGRFARLPHHSPERPYLENYLDWVTSMPWNVRTANDVSIKRAAKILNEDHYGLKKVKERVVEYLAVMKLKEGEKGRKASAKEKARKKGFVSRSPEDEGGPTILCFIGPPGVGKTSIGKSIARALGRKFHRISLGGIRDEAEIRGHRRTYVGALPGRIVQGIKATGTKNPVFMLDEIDKVGIDFRGDPSAALLEALDPEQNHSFSDHYLEVPFDLSEVMFICTGNILDTIPPALKDRMEIIRFSGYTEEEKFNIAKKFLWPKQLRYNGLAREKLGLQPEGLHQIIRRYTREAGVRELERMLATVCRKIAKKKADNKKFGGKVSLSDVRKYLGPAKFTSTVAEKKDEAGMATGLAWTQSGGEILIVETALMPGKGKLLLTGKLGDVMKESAQAAFSYAKSHWRDLGLAENFAKKIDAHIHVPEGAVSKDGPSAGIAMAVSLISALAKRPTRKEIGMTGEITLRGRVLEVGGIKEKVIAAHRAGLKAVILPKDNRKNMEDVSSKVKKDLKFVFVANLDEVLKLVFVPKKARKRVAKKDGEARRKRVAISRAVPAS
jgi:ATP-dependent Lon protease